MQHTGGKMAPGESGERVGVGKLGYSQPKTFIKDGRKERGGRVNNWVHKMRGES